MPELAPIETRPPAGSCPTAEDLACYIDGALSPEEAARVTEHLASCESCFEVYSEVVRFQLESAPEADDNVITFPEAKRGPVPAKRSSVLWWYSVAALLVVGCGLGAYSHLLTPPPALATQEVASPLQAKAATLKDQLWTGPRNRGAGGIDDDERYDLTSFKVGVQLVNLQVSLAANDVKSSQDAIAGIYGALDTPYGTADLQGSYKKLTGAIEDAKVPRELLPQASRLAKESRDYLDPLYLDLGQWVEAGRLAAISQDPAFFRLPASRSFLRHALWRDRLGFKDSKLPEKSRGELDAISQLLAKGDLQPMDYHALKDHFDNLLRANYPD